MPEASMLNSRDAGHETLSHALMGRLYKRALAPSISSLTLGFINNLSLETAAGQCYDRL